MEVQGLMVQSHLRFTYYWDCVNWTVTNGLYCTAFSGCLHTCNCKVYPHRASAAVAASRSIGIHGDAPLTLGNGSGTNLSSITTQVPMGSNLTLRLMLDAWRSVCSYFKTAVTPKCFTEFTEFSDRNISQYSKKAQTCHLLWRRPGCYHSASKTHVRQDFLIESNSCFSDLSYSLNSLNSLNSKKFYSIEEKLQCMKCKSQLLMKSRVWLDYKLSNCCKK